MSGEWLSLDLVGDPGRAKDVNNKRGGINNKLARAKQPRHFNLYCLSRLFRPGRVAILTNYEAYHTFLLVALDMNLHTTVCACTININTTSSSPRRNHVALR